MTDRQQFILWALAIISILFVSLGVVTCNMHIDYRIAQAVANGANPIDARLAFTSSLRSDELAISKLGDK